MESQMKLGAVLIGGYLLGRTKKGGTALRLATRMLLSGSNANPRELMRDNAMRLVQSPETQAIIEGLRAQIMEAASAALDARVNQIAGSLTERTEALKNPASKAADTASDTVGGVTDKITDTSDEEEQDDEQGEQEDPEAEGEAEDGEGEGEGEGAGGEDEAAEEEEEPEESEDAEGVDEPEDEDGNDPSTYADDGVDLSERIEELMKLRITSLRRMARELRYEDEDVADAEKRDLAGMVAEAEAEDEQEPEDEEPEDEADEPEEEPEPKPAKKTAKKTAKKSPAKKTAKKSTTKKAAR